MGAVKRGVRNAFRNVTRTVAVVLIVSATFALALAMFIAHEAASQSVQSVSSNFGTLVTITPVGYFGGFGGGNPLTSAEIAQVASTPNVISVASSVTDRVDGPGTSSPTFRGSQPVGTTSLRSALKEGSLGRHFGGGFGFQPPNPNSPAPIGVIGSNTPLSPALFHATSVTLEEGTAINGNSSDLDADVGSLLASKNGLAVGTTFTAYGKKITVAGIFTSDSETATAEFVLPLKTEEGLAGIAGVTSAVATVNTLSNVQSTTTAIQNELGSSVATVTSSSTGTAQAASDLNSIKSISLFSLVGAIVAAIAILLMSMLMIVRERRREIGILKAFGSSNGGVVSSFVSEALTLTILSAIIGTLIGVVIANPILGALKNNSSPSGGRGGFGGFGGFGGGGGGFGFRPGLSSSTLSHLHAVFGTSAIIYCLVIAIGIALVGSAVPAYAIAKVRPAEVLRSE